MVMNSHHLIENVTCFILTDNLVHWNHIVNRFLTTFSRKIQIDFCGVTCVSLYVVSRNVMFAKSTKIAFSISRFNTFSVDL